MRNKHGLSRMLFDHEIKKRPSCFFKKKTSTRLNLPGEDGEWHEFSEPIINSTARQKPAGVPRVFVLLRL